MRACVRSYPPNFIKQGDVFIYTFFNYYCYFVQVPEETADILKRNNFQWEYRGVIKVKGKQPMTTYFIIGGGDHTLESSGIISLDHIKVVDEQAVSFPKKIKIGKTGKDIELCEINGNSLHSGPKPLNTAICNGAASSHLAVERCTADLSKDKVVTVNNVESDPSMQKECTQNVTESRKEHGNNVTECCEKKEENVTESHEKNEKNVTESQESEKNLLTVDRVEENVTESKKSDLSANEQCDLKSQRDPSLTKQCGKEDILNIDEVKCKNSDTESEQTGKHISKEEPHTLRITVPSVSAKHESEPNISERCKNEQDVRRKSKSETNLTIITCKAIPSSGKTTCNKTDGKNGLKLQNTDVKPVNCFKTKITCNGLEPSKYDEFCEKSCEHERVIVGNTEVIMRKSVRMKDNDLEQTT